MERAVRGRMQNDECRMRNGAAAGNAVRSAVSMRPRLV